MERTPLKDFGIDIPALREEIVTTLCDLVRLPSITGNEAEMGRSVAAFCEAAGFNVEIVSAAPDRPNVIATYDTGRPGPKLLLNDHLDIVPPGPLEYWDHPPFDPLVKDGRVYGRGTIDTKSGLTTILYAAREAVAKAPLCGTLTLIFSCDEEVGGALGMQHLGRNGYLDADFALVAEPTSMQVEIATKGRLHLEISAEGKATHAARPWLGHSAIEDMTDVILALRAYADELATRTDPLLGQASVCVGTIAGGTVPNMVPNRCTLGLDRRALPSEDVDAVRAELAALVKRVEAARPGAKFSIAEKVWWPGYKIDADEPIIAETVDAFEMVTGRRPDIKGKDAGTDASWINTLGGIPVVMFSPGSGPDAMNANENVGIDDLVTATAVVTQLVVNILGARP
ncbi:MAG: M20 family metallopeptidase [Pseudomonadota bacterium]